MQILCPPHLLHLGEVKGCVIPGVGPVSSPPHHHFEGSGAEDFQGSCCFPPVYLLHLCPQSLMLWSTRGGSTRIVSLVLLPGPCFAASVRGWMQRRATLTLLVAAKWTIGAISCVSSSQREYEILIWRCGRFIVLKGMVTQTKRSSSGLFCCLACQKTMVGLG